MREWEGSGQESVMDKEIGRGASKWSEGVGREQAGVSRWRDYSACGMASTAGLLPAVGYYYY